MQTPRFPGNVNAMNINLFCIETGIFQEITCPPTDDRAVDIVNSLRPSDAYGSLNEPPLFQTMVWHLAGAKPLSESICLIRPLGTNFSEILIEIHMFLFKKMHLNISSGKWRPFCLGLNVLDNQQP